MKVFALISLIFLASTVVLWTILSYRYKKALTKPNALFVLKTDKWTHRVNYAASIFVLIAAFMQIIIASISRYQTLMN